MDAFNNASMMSFSSPVASTAFCCLHTQHLHIQLAGGSNKPVLPEFDMLVIAPVPAMPDSGFGKKIQIASLEMVSSFHFHYYRYSTRYSSLLRRQHSHSHWHNGSNTLRVRQDTWEKRAEKHMPAGERRTVNCKKSHSRCLLDVTGDDAMSGRCSAGTREVYAAQDRIF